MGVFLVIESKRAMGAKPPVVGGKRVYGWSPHAALGDFWDLLQK